MDDLNNIFSEENILNDEQLKKYALQQSSPEEQYSVEKQINDSSFVNDATEGLQQFSSAKKMNSYVQQINENLNQRFKTKRKKKYTFNNLSWELVALIIILLLCFIGYAVIEMIKK